ncbi:MAG: hypothetical protein QOD39_1626, partial [Mycobacterium sp.]|nr:hypothetical protein [Mycobacterium sp.]
LGRMASGCFCAISLRLGNVSGSATAIAIQTPITIQGHRTTTSANRRKSTHAISYHAYATRPQFPVLATRPHTDFIASM